jgi:hypothetical protein
MRSKGKNSSYTDQKANGLPLMNGDGSDESELSSAQVGIEAPESLLESWCLKLAYADLTREG